VLKPGSRFDQAEFRKTPYQVSVFTTMQPLVLHEFHDGLNARFTSLNGWEIVAGYQDSNAEYSALQTNAGVLDLSFRSRICLTGSDRIRFLHGQVTNDVKRLGAGQGCYAALVTAKGKMQSDLNIYSLQDELLLDFEPGLTELVTQRLEKYLVADDVQIVDVASHYGLLSVQGPKAADVVRQVELFSDLPANAFQSVKVSDPTLGDIYLMNQPRLGSSGFDLFVPTNALGAVADKLIASAKGSGGGACGWEAFEIARIEAGIPRFGVDMDESNIPLECGIESRAVSYRKGCYIGQEVVNRIHSIGHVNRELRVLRLPADLKTLPVKGDKLFHDGKEVGYITSAVESPTLQTFTALGYVRREVNQVGTELRLKLAEGEVGVVVSAMPFCVD
jgi:folate-binding protein YgfZ